jgi:M6 family metalloprotease-like protein
MNLPHKIRIVGALLVTLGLTGAPAARALEDATAFGFNNMRAAGTRPLLVILVQDPGMPRLAHDASYYDRLIFGPLGGGRPEDRSVIGYYAEVSNGNFLWTRAGVVGPLTIEFSSRDEGQMRSTAVKQAGEVGGVDYARFDRNGDGAVTPDELGVLVIIQWPVAQTSFHTVSVGGKSVRVGVSGVGDRPNLNILCHELSHQLGTLDLYGRWGVDCLNSGLTLMSCILGGADEVRSVHLDAWHKMQLGWVQPRIRDIRTPGFELLEAPQVASRQGLSNESPILLYDPARGTSEFFLLEYRSRTARGGSYDADVGSTGLAIWQVRQDSAKQPAMTSSEADPSAQILAMFNRGAPSWVQGGGTLYTESHGAIALKWLDNSGTGVRLKAGSPSADGALLSVTWARPGQSVDWGPSVSYDRGLNPAVAYRFPNAVEVHQGGPGVGPLWYHVGNGKGQTIQWGQSIPYDNGLNPAVALDGTRVVEVHQGAADVGTLWYHVGTVRPDLTIKWGPSIAYDSGLNPAIAMSGTQIVEVHQAGSGVGPLWSRVGTLSATEPTIQWGPSVAYDTGLNPAVAMLGDRVIEVHQAGLGVSPLWSRVGATNGRSIQWGAASQYDIGLNPAVSADLGQVIEVHQGQQGAGPLWYHLGVIDSPTLAMRWEPSLPYDTGLNPAVAATAAGLSWIVLDVHQAEPGVGPLWHHLGTVFTTPR